MRPDTTTVGYTSRELFAGMPRTDGSIARRADYLEVVVLTKLLSHLAFRDKETLAIVTPSLKISRHGAVLYEAQNLVRFLDMVAAHYGVDWLVVCAAS